jgi:hypothetical protein
MRRASASGSQCVHARYLCDKVVGERRDGAVQNRSERTASCARRFAGTSSPTTRSKWRAPAAILLKNPASRMAGLMA